MSPLAGKYATAYWLNKSIVLFAAALLIALVLTQFARFTTVGSQTVHDAQVKAGLMGRGGQFEKPPLW